MEVHIDADIGQWVIEFLIRQSLDDRLLSSLINTFRLPNESSSLKKAILLRRIESEISKGPVSEDVLDLLQQIEELDFQEGIKEHSDTIKAAYCAVAVACTVKFLKINGDDSKFKYFDAVKGIWRGRVCKMEKQERIGLSSEELRSWKEEIEAAVWEESVCDNVLKRSEGVDAFEAVRVYIQEEKVKMGPSFLELVAQASRADDQLRGLLGVACNGKFGGETVANFANADQNLNQSNGNTEVQKGNVLSRSKHVSHKRTKGTASTGAKIADTDNSEVDLAFKKHDLPPTPDVNEVEEALVSSSLELQAAVKDPLPDALHLAETVLSGMARKEMNNVPVRESHDRTNPPVAESTRVAQANGENHSNHCCRRQDNAPKPSLMARNSTAFTFEWDDSIDGSPEDSPNHGGRLQLPSPKRRAVSPLKKYEFNKLMKRRKIKRWSTLEEDTLRTGVQKYGTGNWKLILNAYRDVFQERTEVDLKDKWRNMIRY